METESTPRPQVAVRLGAISAAVFQNHDDQGQARGLSVSFTKRYWDAADKAWKSSRCYLSPDQVPAAITVLRRIEELLLGLSHGPSTTNETPPS